MIEVTLGLGKVYISAISGEDGTPGLLLKNEPEAHPIGAHDAEFDNATIYRPTEGDIVIWVRKIESARVLQDAVNAVALALLDYGAPSVDDIKVIPTTPRGIE